MAFKDHVARDSRNVFLDVAEFAELHTVDGRRVASVLDEPVRGERDFPSGLASDTYVLYAADADLMDTRPGGVMVVDGLPFAVVDERSDMGVRRVSLVRAQ